MDWVISIVLLIALVVWILVNLVKVPEDKNPRDQRPRPPGVPRDPRGDLQRFVEDAKRRRQMQEQPWDQGMGTAPLPPAMNPDPILPRVRPNPLPPSLPRYSPPSRPPTVIPVVKAVVPRRQDFVPRQPEPEPIIATEVVSEPPRQLTVSQEAVPLSAYTLRQRVSLTSGSGAARQVVQMLNDPNAARIALLLREILDRPISLRMRRR